LNRIFRFGLFLLYSFDFFATMFEMYDNRQFVDAEYLDEDELDYELVIRLERNALRKDVPEKRRIIRSNVRAEEADIHLFPVSVEFDLEAEMVTCADKLSALSIFCQDPNGRRSRNFERKVSSKLNHIEQRARRVSHTDPSYKPRTEQLAAVVREIRRHLLGMEPNMNTQQQSNANIQSNQQVAVSNQQSSTVTIPTSQATTVLNRTHDLNLEMQGPTTNLNDQRPPWGHPSFGSEVPVEIALEMESLRRQIQELQVERETNRNSGAIPKNTVPTSNYQPPSQQTHPVIQPTVRSSSPNIWNFQNNQQPSTNDNYFSTQYRQPNQQYYTPIIHPTFVQDQRFFSNPNQQVYIPQNQYSMHQNRNIGAERAHVMEDRSYHKTLPVSKWGLTFSGEGRTGNLQDFLTRVNVLAKAERCSPEELRRSAYHLFSGPAKEWYVAFGDDFVSWDDVVQELKLYHLSPDNDKSIRRYIDARRQKRGESFLTYLADMELNFKKLSYTVSQQEKVQTIKDNLNSYFAEKLILIDINSMEQLKQCCRKIEALNVYRPEANNFTKPRFEPPARRVSELVYPGEEDEVDPATEEDGRKFEDGQVCAVRGPTTNRVPKTARSFACQTDPIPEYTATPTSNMKCYNCQNYGHHHTVCPVPKKNIYCYRCGTPDVILSKCQRCNSGNGNRGAEKGAVSRQ
jgi:hypothetical protein